MANILIRSPRYEQVTATGMESCTLELSVDSVLIYTITKNANIEAEKIVFEISELVRDYIEHDPSIANCFNRVNVSAEFTTFDDVNGGGTQISNFTRTHVAYDGYNEFTDGINPTIANGNIGYQSNTDIYLPENTASYIASIYGATGKIPISSSLADGSTIVLNNETYKIHRICEPKYTPTLITFVNKYGLRQEMWFFHVQRESLSVSSEKYKRNLYNFTSNTYDTKQHQSQTYNVKANEKLTLNTPFVRENYNEALKELLLSEYVWATIGGSYVPVRLSTQSLDYKTEVNDKLIQYTIEFDYAFDLINKV